MLFRSLYLGINNLDNFIRHVGSAVDGFINALYPLWIGILLAFILYPIVKKIENLLSICTAVFPEALDDELRLGCLIGQVSWKHPEQTFRKHLIPEDGAAVMKLWE